MLLNLVLWCLYLDIKIALRFNGWAYVIFYNECFCFRPLPAELMKYAREDTHYLTYIYHRMKQELLARGNDQKNLLLSVLQRSTEICAKVQCLVCILSKQVQMINLFFFVMAQFQNENWNKICWIHSCSNILILDIVYKSNIEHSCNTLKKQTNIKKLVL